MRQLENAVFRAVVLADGDEIGAPEFPQLALAADARRGARDRARRMKRRSRRAAANARSSSTRSRAPRPRRRRSRPETALALTDADGHVRPLEEIEAEVIRFAIAHYRGQMSEVARRLRIGRSTLYRKLDEIGLGAGDSRTRRRKRGERVTVVANCAHVMNRRTLSQLIS